MVSTNIFDRNARKGAWQWINLPQVLAISHILTLGFQHLELVVEGLTPPWWGLSLSAYYRESKLCGFYSYCSTKSQMHSEIHHGNGDTEHCLLFSFSSPLQEACFQPILLQYSRPRCIMCQTLEVHLITEKNAFFLISLQKINFFFFFLISSFFFLLVFGCHTFQFQ